MAELIGFLTSALLIFGGLMGGFMIGEGLFTVFSLLATFGGIILVFVTSIISLFFPQFGYRRYAILKPAKAYEDACEATTVRWHLEGDLLNDLANLAMESFKIKRRHYAKMTFEKLAEYHYPGCAAMIGKFYKEGYGCFHNYEKAAKWLQQAIEDEKPCYYYPSIWDAQSGSTCYSPKYVTDPYSDLAELYLYGHGVPKDEDKALELFSQAHDKGNEERFFYVKRAKELKRKNRNRR